MHAVDHGLAVLAMAIFWSALWIRSFSIAGHRSYALPPFLQVDCAESGLRQVFGINDHQFLTLLFIQQMLHPTETLGILALVCLDETLHPKAFH